MPHDLPSPCSATLEARLITELSARKAWLEVCTLPPVSVVSVAAGSSSCMGCCCKAHAPACEVPRSWNSSRADMTCNHCACTAACCGAARSELSSQQQGSQWQRGRQVMCCLGHNAMHHRQGQLRGNQPLFQGQLPSALAWCAWLCQWKSQLILGNTSLWASCSERCRQHTMPLPSIGRPLVLPNSRA